MPRVSVASVKKPTPALATFKFLRRDEGRLSYSQNAPETLSSKGAEASRADRERRDSKSLREAIAYDMRNARSHDPLGEIVVAVPKKAVPPGRGGESPAARPPDPPRRVPSRGASSRRPAWVDPELPARRVESFDDGPEDVPPLGPSDGIDAPSPPLFFAERGPYNGAPLRRTSSVAPHHVDPAYAEYDRNYFRRSPQLAREHDLLWPSRGHGDEALVLELEQEIRAVKEERARYRYAKSQLDRERQRFETYKLDAQQQLDDERANLAALRAQDQREARKEVHSIDERYKNATSVLSVERETNKRLVQENEVLHAQLEELTSTMRESQAAHRAEVARMRRDIDSLTRRNSELLAMAKEKQIHNLVMPSGKPKPIAAIGARSPTTRKGDSESNTIGFVSAEPPKRSIHTPTTAKGERVGKEKEEKEQEEDEEEEEGEEGEEEEEEEKGGGNSSSHSNGAPAKPAYNVVFDFTPQTPNTAARQRRAKAVEERMQREEEERQQRRLLREQEEAAAARTAQETRASSLNKRQSERPEDALRERKATHHPLRTPRVVGRGKSTPAAKPVAIPLKLKPHIPTRRELLQELEPAPEENYPDDEILSETTQAGSPNKREVSYRSGKKEIHYANGTVKVVLPSQHVILHFTNGDTKCTYPSGKSTYWYDSAQTTHTQLPTGVQLFEFCATGQSERHMPDGTREIVYPDGVYKIVHADGSDETYLPDES